MRQFLIAIVVLLAASFAAKAQTYKVTGSIPVPGEGGWDYLFADSDNRVLYVAHDTQVNAIDLDSEKPVGAITGMKHVHGIAVAHEFNRGFITDGGDNVVVIFDLKSRAVLQKVPAGDKPDGIVYDEATKRVFAFNGHSGDVTAIDAATGQVAGTVPLGGKPEFPVSDNAGNIYDNIENKSEVVRIDPKELKVTARWSTAPAEEPSGMAYDSSGKRIFSVCDNKKMSILNAENGKLVATVPIGDGPDATVYDAEKKLVFSSNGDDGTLTIVKQESPDKYSVVTDLKTEKSGRTLALDKKTHKIYIAAAQFGAAPAATADNPHPRHSITSGSFHLIVVSPE